MQIHLVPVEVWRSQEEGKALADLCIPLLRRSERFAAGRVKAEDWIVDCVLDRYSAWIAVDDSGLKMCCITSISQHPRMNCFAIHAIGAVANTMEQWLPQMFIKFCELCEENEITRIETGGRKGWSRVLAKYGFTSNVVLFEADACQVYSAAVKRLQKSKP